jgi:hypothetical protein
MCLKIFGSLGIEPLARSLQIYFMNLLEVAGINAFPWQFP